MAIWNILQTFGIFYDHLVHFVFIWYIFSGLANIYQEKSGNPAYEYSNSGQNCFIRSIPGVDVALDAALSPLPADGRGHDGVELVAAPQPELERVAGLQLVAVDVESEVSVVSRVILIVLGHCFFSQTYRTFITM
jgi:hypothetical protein